MGRLFEPGKAGPEQYPVRGILPAAARVAPAIACRGAHAHRALFPPMKTLNFDASGSDAGAALPRGSRRRLNDSTEKESSVYGLT
jgi:hypothetical protein